MGDNCKYIKKFFCDCGCCVEVELEEGGEWEIILFIENVCEWWLVFCYIFFGFVCF